MTNKFVQEVRVIDDYVIHLFSEMAIDKKEDRHRLRDPHKKMSQKVNSKGFRLGEKTSFQTWESI